MTKVYLLLVLISAAFLFFSCKDSGTIYDLDKVDIPDKDVSFVKHIQPVFEYKCNNKYCHNDEDRAGGLSLTSYQNTTADLSIVFPGEPQNSRLAIVIQPGSGSIQMPPINYPALTEEQIKGIITWIKEGAKNN